MKAFNLFSVLIVMLFTCSELSAQHVLILEDGSEIPGYRKNDNEFISCSDKTYKLGPGRTVEEDASVNCHNKPDIPLPRAYMSSEFVADPENNSIKFKLSSGADYVVKMDKNVKRDKAFKEFYKKYLAEPDNKELVKKAKKELMILKFKDSKKVK